jgi:hypothetical protein
MAGLALLRGKMSRREDSRYKMGAITPASGGELPAGTDEVVLQVQYSRQSRPFADLQLEIRSRLDLDAADLGSDRSNLPAWQNVEVGQGTGSETLRLSIRADSPRRLPPGSSLVPIASLRDRDSGVRYFHQVFEDSAFEVPDFSWACAFDPAHDTLEVVEVTGPEGDVFTASNPKVLVTVRNALTSLRPQIFTLMGGRVNPGWDGTAADLATWQQHAGSWDYQPLESARGTLTLDVYSWYPSARTRGIVDDERQTALSLALVCGYNACYPSKLPYSQGFSEHVFTFSPELLEEGLLPTPVPSPAPGCPLALQSRADRINTIGHPSGHALIENPWHAHRVLL